VIIDWICAPKKWLVACDGVSGGLGSQKTCASSTENSSIQYFHQNANVPGVGRLVNCGDKVSLGTARRAKAIEQVNAQRTHAGFLTSLVKASIHSRR
jgi:hypothetical protein